MGKGDGSAGRKGKLPPNCYWRGEIIWARFVIRGEEYRESLRTGSPAVAAKRLKLRREQAENEAIYGDAPPKSWKAALVEWRHVAERNVKRSTLKRYLCSLRMVEPFVLDLDIQQLTPAKVREVVAARRRQHATNATIRRDLSALSSVLAYAVGEGWVKANAAREYDRGQVKERRDPITLPDPEDVALVAGLAPGAFADLILDARECGMRQEELAGLHRRQIDESRGVATLRHTKNGRPRAVPLSSGFLARYAARPAYLGSPYAYWHGDGARYANVSSRFAAIVKRAAQKAAQEKRPFTRFRFHDLRHLYAVEELRRGTSIYALQGQMGHSSIKQTEAYLLFLTHEEAERARVGTQVGTEATVYSGDKAASL